MKKKKIFIIVNGNLSDSAGDLYCAAGTQELANKIKDEDVKKDFLSSDSFIVELNFFED